MTTLDQRTGYEPGTIDWPGIVTVTDGRLDVLAPVTLEPAQARRAPANRVRTLDGAVLAVIDNGKNSPNFPTAVIAALKARYALAEVIWVRKPNVSVPPPKADWKEIVDRATVGITMSGECGSCTSRTVRDAIDLELAGIPAVPIVHESLIGAAEAMKKLSRMPDYPYALIRPPTRANAYWSEEECSQIAEYLVPAIVEQLTVQA